MATCVEISAEGFLYSYPVDIENCTSLVVLDSDEYNLIMTRTDVTTSVIVEAYSFGFALVFFGYLISMPIKAALKAVKSV